MNMITYGLNNDTYRMNIKTMTAPEMVNSYDVADGYVYYANSADTAGDYNLYRISSHQRRFLYNLASKRYFISQIQAEA